MNTRRKFNVVRGFETLEERVVLSTTAAAPVPTLGGSLAILGIIPGPPPAPATGSTSAQLAKDTQTLQNDLLSVFSKSSVTVGELTALQGDDQAIVNAGVQLNGTTLMTAQAGLAKAVLSGNPASAQSAFAALFSGTKLTSASVTKAFNDEVQIVKDSHVTPAYLTKIAADNAAIQKDLAGTTPPAPPAAPTPPSNAQLAKDTQKLQNDSLALFAKSGVTVADLTALQGDDQAIVNAGVQLNGKALAAAQGTLAQDVVSGNPAGAQSAFAALFGGKLSTAAITKAFNDEVQIIKDSHVTAADLNEIAADNAAIQKDSREPRQQRQPTDPAAAEPRRQPGDSRRDPGSAMNRSATVCRTTTRKPGVDPRRRVSSVESVSRPNCF